jgi:gamma-glutamyl-gamma-aminobutyrate hydrolase PuuD
MVQFHPEELFEFHEPSQRLFRAFVNACARSARGIGSPAATVG